MQEVTAVVGIVVVQPPLSISDQTIPANQHPNDLCGKAKTGYQMNEIFTSPMKAHVQRKNNRHNRRRKEQKRHFEGDLRAREGAQVRII